MAVRSERERVAQREEVLVLEDKLWKKGKELEELHTVCPPPPY